MFQHTIFQYEDNEIEQLIEYIRKFVSNDYAAFEFFKDGKYAMSGSKKSNGIDLTTNESVLKTFIPDLSGEQIEQRALTLSEVLPDISYEEHKIKITNTADEVRKQHYEYLKKHKYMLGIEFWNGKEFDILNITLGNHLEKDKIKHVIILSVGAGVILVSLYCGIDQKSMTDCSIYRVDFCEL